MSRLATYRLQKRKSSHALWGDKGAAGSRDAAVKGPVCEWGKRLTAPGP